MEKHPAEEFRNLRAKYFSIANKHGFDKAFYILETDREKNHFNPQVYTGLLSELIFYNEGCDVMDLTPTLDCGDHCDFRGSYNNNSARFDVTSSLTYKDLDTYSDYQKKGQKYYIALIDHDSKKIDRIIDINFPFCKECGGHLINIVLIGDTKYTNNGTPTQSQQIIEMCSQDISHKNYIKEYEYFIPSMNNEIKNSKGFLQDEISKKHGINNALFFGKLINDKIHACGHEKLINSGSIDDGDWSTELFWMSDMVDSILPNQFDTSLWY
ncbi:hypothetical protein EG349_15585 [Chryseobacterium shandongense]|uniref:Uncharacterized protein n=1 Tax=Chryseobacterium shandongense TaxID=1493872 RepID=A0AAD1DNE6_9FLAO|nr:hypothetical protein [Chryseobacterium shandongense]AZA88115.1 hypothetical protein EG349_15585 [Chryseobacterium shandongense]AZA96676.1 hypothetical protein EG353_14370 [Chryseobacterium shandongense]